MTAVEWLIGELTNLGYIVAPSFGHSIIDLKIKQAKEMEKQQMSKIYEGILQNVGTSIKQSDLPTFEQYYSETYGSKGSDELGQSLEWNGEVTNGNSVEKVPNVTSIFLEGYEQINQDNPVTRGSTALVKVSKSTSSQKEISDEEIEMAALHNETRVTRRAFKSGAKWYRERLKQ